MYIDTHSHIYEEEFREDREEALFRAKTAGVEYIILPDIDSQSRERMIALADRHPEMTFPLIGLHPTSVNEDYLKELKLVEKWLATGRFYGIGECGIDLYWDKNYYKEQIKAFEYQLGMAREAKLPIVIHSRSSLNEIFRILKGYPYIQGVLHCFPGNEEEARRACDKGLMLGIGGVVTFKNSGMAKVVEQTDLEHLLLETDSPYLTPVPHRGERNESAYIPLIAQKIAELKKAELKKVEEITTRNAVNLFSLQSKIQC